MEMESFMDDLLNFSVPEDEEDDDNDMMQPPRNITRQKTGLRLFNTDDPGVIEEEDLEWISNKDAFPVIETFVDALIPSERFRIASPEREAAEGKQLSPVSVLETSSHSSTTTTTSNSSGGSTAVATTTATTTIMSCCISFKAPAKARSKRRRTGRRDLRVLWTGNNNEGGGGIQKRKTPSASAVVIIGRKCQHCGAEKTPQWRAGPSGPKTLCNACGVRYKSGRLVPEYRPANSPTFSADLHSNSHRKIVEMRKQYQSGDGDRKDCG